MVQQEPKREAIPPKQPAPRQAEQATPQEPAPAPPQESTRPQLTSGERRFLDVADELITQGEQLRDALARRGGIATSQTFQLIRGWEILCNTNLRYVNTEAELAFIDIRGMQNASTQIMDAQIAYLRKMRDELRAKR